MRGLVWLLGVMVILLGFEAQSLNPGRWAVVWGIAAALWSLVGCVVIIYRVARAALSKKGAGALESFKARVSTPPARTKEE